MPALVSYREEIFFWGRKYWEGNACSSTDAKENFGSVDEMGQTFRGTLHIMGQVLLFPSTSEKLSARLK